MNETVEMFRESLDKLAEKGVTPPSLPYEKKLVAFIDILGVSDKVDKGGDEAKFIVDLMNQIRNCVSAECTILQDKGLLNSLQIGDGYLITAEFKCINDICQILCAVQWQILIEQHMLLRGALTAGAVAIGDSEEYFIGPAIIKAYALERQNAIFPRIIFHSKEIEKYVTKISIDYKYIAEDQDKTKYLDFIKYYMDSEELAIEALAELLKKNEVNKTIKTEYEKYISSKDTEKEAQKWGWLISKFALHGIKIM